MARPTEFVRFVLELLAPVGEVRARSMFGGFGIYRLTTMFAIVVDGRLYFKKDDAGRRNYLAQGLSPLTYIARGKTIALQYYEAPPDVFESPEAMQAFAREAIDSALRAKKSKRGQ